MRDDLPGAEALRDALYRGEIFLLPATRSSLAFVERLRQRVFAAIGGDFSASTEVFVTGPIYDHVRSIRSDLVSQPIWLDDVADILRDLGLSPAEFRVDAPRLRGIEHEGHSIAAAAPAYYAHRDTWYGNPSAQINVWIPLHDVVEAATFVFYPEYFDRPIPNDSRSLDVDEFVRREGWKDGTSDRVVYPRALADLVHAQSLGFSARRGQILLFAAAHLHEPRRNTTGSTRFSADFRIVHERDHASGRGAPNVDNEASGSTFGSYRSLETERARAIEGTLD